jgi:hypothetical protein
MLLCEDWIAESNRISVLGLLSNLTVQDVVPYPALLREMCVLLTLTEGRGAGKGQIACVFEETGETVFAS